ncbi:Aconitase/3-isopropylmalate dehydratase large subunit alpha/beta/alpha subdomain 1/3 [Penicillium angulare]|uniref:Aconitase/3-isopropylmalate dehydratase large subunit alpha/beta/alpha subdomain 1/3 n=1 Tax=Penicillium angulare TaxID=116970 RepID=UPI002540EE4B|nr:Aconitase/3-isopropylmalate dehydratase large subunit alpha/beta/alpha subdomain 1/3 [Penicillium angulare]KAJ5272959.1 Aconitase/3-isopropylmalate dehydratase large subunit alpha/beta/alpha subdomain 1/3 [Penicillium angulare]
MILNDTCPKALIFGREEMILTIGVLVAQEIFQKSLPVLQVPISSYEQLLQHNRTQIHITENKIHLDQSDEMINKTILDSSSVATPSFDSHLPAPHLTPFDHELLSGSHGKAAKIAMRVILQTAQIQGVTELIDVKQAHIDCCIYTGPATLKFAQQLCSWGAKLRIPTSLNSISVDRRLWRSQGVDKDLGEPSEALAQAYLDMGAQPTFTCAPYLLETAPQPGEHITWAESNAVVFANSILGARTIKCPDFLDVCVALTGRALNTGCHLTEYRKASVQIHVEDMDDADDSLFPIVGYIAGDIAADRIPIITGLEKKQASTEDLKAFGAAFATTSSAPMFHIAGITLEASSAEEIKMQTKDTAQASIKRSDLAKQWLQFNKYENHEPHTNIDLVSLGNPHFSYIEIKKLVSLCSGRQKNDTVTFVITCNRDTYSKASREGYISALEGFGAQILTDTCWCMIQEPIVPFHSKVIMTNSAKYAHYGKGLTGRKMRFGGLRQCVDAACVGQVMNSVPGWLKT